MTPVPWHRIKQAFHDALDRPAEARRDWLERTFPEDDPLRREVLSLLEADERSGDFLTRPATIDPLDLVSPGEAPPADEAGRDEREPAGVPGSPAAPAESSPAPAETLPPGARVGPYAIRGVIGRGGMGIVYHADDTRLGRPVALKALPLSAAGHAERRERLRREARAAATIAHPSVAVVYALDEIDGQLFIASEYVPGLPLRSLIAQGPVHPRTARRVALEMAQALEAAHQAGVIHRDLKPENVVLSETGSVKVVDFGIAGTSDPHAARLTREGALIGTPAYMAPEQLLGLRAGPGADIYACGVVLGEMLTGRHPMAGVDEDARLRMPPPLRAIVERCLRADPAERFGSAGELRQALEAAALETPAGQVHAGGDAAWWWRFHQGAAAAVYAGTLLPGWRARQVVGGSAGRTFFLALTAAVVVAAALRLHLSFAGRFYPAELDWARSRSRRWVAAGDWLLALTLAAGALLTWSVPSHLDIVLLSLALGVVVTRLVVEPVTTRAAFGPERRS